VNPCAIVPALDAAGPVEGVVRGALRILPRVIVVDDGSRDGTGEVARRAGAEVVRHDANRGKGAAIRTGLLRAAEQGHDVAVTIDADGQHDPEDLPALLAPADPRALVLGVRDLAAAGAPRANRISNAISNFFVSRFAGTPLPDTQCGYRRYPVDGTLALGLCGTGYEMEAEAILRARRARWPIVGVPIHVRYPPGRTTHFRILRDVPRIIGRVILTVSRG
jgi:glycosyltransferase involved in cell wall biosynthesis